MFTPLDLCVSSLRRGHANLFCIVPILTDDPRRESKKCCFLECWLAFAMKCSCTAPCSWEVHGTMFWAVPEYHNGIINVWLKCSACALLMCCLCTPHPALRTPHCRHPALLKLTGLLGGMSLVEIHLLQRRGQQPGISMFVGSIPQHNTLPHQDSKESMFCKMSLPRWKLKQESLLSFADRLLGHSALMVAL